MPLILRIGFPFFNRYREHLKVSVVFQVFLLLLSAITLDGGALNKFMVFAAAVNWIIVAIVMVRRDDRATPLDRFLLMCGFFAAMPLIMAVGSVVPVGALRPH